MLDIYIGKNKTDVAYLSLPATPGETGEAYLKLEQYGPQPTDGEPVCIQIARSSVPFLGVTIKGMNYDDVRVSNPLNYLAKRIACLSQTEQDIFSAALQMEGVKEVKDLINLSFHLHNYELYRDISDVGNLSRIMLSRMEGVEVPIEISHMLDFDKISSEYFKSHKGEFTPSGLVLKKEDAKLGIVYDGLHYIDPGYEVDALFYLYVSARGEGKKYQTFALSLPAMEERLELAKQVLGVEAFGGCEVNSFGGGQDELWDYIPVGVCLEQLNKLADFLKKHVLDGTKHPYEKLLAVLEAECPRTLDETWKIVNSFSDYEVCPESVRTMEDYVGYMLGQDSDYYLDSVAVSVMDLERYGAAILKEEGAIMTSHGIVSADKWKCPRLTDDLNTIRLMSPLEGNLYPRDAYGEYADASMVLDGSDLLAYEAMIRERLAAEDWSYEGEAGLALYLNNALLKRRVVSLFPSIMECSGVLYGTLEVVSKGELNAKEIDEIKRNWQGQASDGWGEGFEQREIKVEDGLLTVSFYPSQQPFEVWESEAFSSALQAEDEMQVGMIT